MTQLALYSAQTIIHTKLKKSLLRLIKNLVKSRERVKGERERDREREREREMVKDERKRVDQTLAIVESNSSSGLLGLSYSSTTAILCL